MDLPTDGGGGRRSAPLEFNAYINASDRLEEFVRYLGSLGVRQGEVMGLPLGLFVTWLIIEAARFDGDAEPPERLRLTGDLRRARAPRCRWCGRFIRAGLAAKGVAFCRSEHMGRFIGREAA